MSKKIIKTGETVPISGQYLSKSSNTEYTFVKGNKVPPSSKTSSSFVLVDTTKHKGGTK